jgi:hypothetical protein
MKKAWIEVLVLFLVGVFLGTGLYGILVGPSYIWWISFWCVIGINFWATETLFRKDDNDDDYKNK